MDGLDTRRGHLWNTGNLPIFTLRFRVTCTKQELCDNVIGAVTADGAREY